MAAPGHLCLTPEPSASLGGCTARAPVTLLLLLTLLVPVAGGLLCLSLSSRPRLATWIGVGGVVVGCAIGLVPAAQALFGAETLTFRRPWSVPYGEFSIALDPLSGLFLIVTFGLSLVAALFGGPLLDRQGRVIGINTQIVSNTGGSVGIGFAIPVDTAKRVVPAIIAKGRVEYAYLGISGTTLTRQLAQAMALPTDTRGVLVAKVAAGGPAEKAALKGSDKIVTVEGTRTTVGGDVITAINGAAVRIMDELLAFLSKAAPGDKITLNVLHADGTRASMEVTLGSRP